MNPNNQSCILPAGKPLTKECHFGNRKKQYQNYRESEQIKTLLGTSVGEAIKNKPQQQLNVKQEFQQGRARALSNQFSYLQSNIFNDSSMQLRNDKLFLQVNKTLKEQKKEKLNKSEIAISRPKNSRGTLSKEFKFEEFRKSGDQNRSLIFHNLDKYYAAQTTREKPKFMPATLNFLNHDSVKNKRIEYQEQQLQQEYIKSKPQYKLPTEPAIIEERFDWKTENIEKFTNPVKQNQKEPKSYKIQIKDKSKSFYDKQFITYCNHNGFQVTKKENTYLLNPKNKDIPSINSVVKYLKDNDNQIVVYKEKQT